MKKRVTNMQRLFPTGLRGVAIGLPLLAAHGGASAAWDNSVSAELRSAVSDNIRMSTQDEDSAVVTEGTIEGRARRVTETSLVALVGGFTYQYYSGVSNEETLGEVDDQDLEYVDFLASRSGERVSGSLHASVNRDVMYQSVEYLGAPAGSGEGGDSEAGDVPGTDLSAPPGSSDVDVGSVEEQIERLRIVVSPTLAYQLSERTSLDVGYGFTGLEYDEAEDLGFEDGESHSVFAGLTRQLSASDFATLRVGAARFEPDVSDETESWEVVGGWRRQLSERSSVELELGLRNASANGNDDYGTLVRVRGERGFERGRLFAEAERSLYPSGYGSLLETDQVLLTFQRGLSDRWRFDFSGRAYQTNSSVDESQTTGADERKFVDVGPSLSWSASETVELGVGYHYTWVDREIDDDTASGNSVSIFITFNPQRPF
jgi:hypothetical protein